MFLYYGMQLGKPSPYPYITPQPSIMGLKKGFTVQKWDDSLVGPHNGYDSTQN